MDEHLETSDSLRIQITNQIRKVKNKIDELKTYNPNYRYYMDFEVEIENLIIRTGLIELGEKHYPKYAIPYNLKGEYFNNAWDCNNEYILWTNLLLLEEFLDFYLSNHSLYVKSISKLSRFIKTALSR